MAARKSSRGKSRGTRPKARKGGAKTARKSSARKSSARKASAKRPTARKKSPAKKSSGSRSMKRSSNGARRKSPMQRVTNVAKQVALQAQAAVSGGVEALREMGETIAERVGGQD